MSDILSPQSYACKSENFNNYPKTAKVWWSYRTFFIFIKILFTMATVGPEYNSDEDDKNDDYEKLWVIYFIPFVRGYQTLVKGLSSLFRKR